jgi:peptidase E
MEPLAYTRQQTIEQGIPFIKSTSLLTKLKENAGFDNTQIEPLTIRELKKYYDGLQLKDLITIWHDNYNSLMIMRGQVKHHNATSFLVTNKILAIAAIINEKY